MGNSYAAVNALRGVERELRRDLAGTSAALTTERTKSEMLLAVVRMLMVHVSAGSKSEDDKAACLHTARQAIKNATGEEMQS